MHKQCQSAYNAFQIEYNFHRLGNGWDVRSAHIYQNHNNKQLNECLFQNKPVHWALLYRFSLLVLHEIWDRSHAKGTQMNMTRPIKFINQFRQFIWHNPVKCVSHTYFTWIHSISASAWETSIFENISNVFSILNSFPEKNRDDEN